MAEPRAVGPEYDWAAVLTLLQDSFAYMEGRIDPPSSLHRLSIAKIAAFAAQERIVVIEEGGAPVACAFLTLLDDQIYIGKLAVADRCRGRGLAAALIAYANDLALETGRMFLELETRIELVENHAAFGRMGFFVTEQTSHPGYDRVTGIIMRKRVSR